MTTEYFTEIQRFRQPWLWVLLAGIAGLFGWGIIQQLIMGIPWGNNPASDTGLIFFSLIPIAIMLLFVFARLETRLDRTGISYRFIPFHIRVRTIYWRDISKASVITYNPLTDFGGWGVRMGRNGERAFNVSGREGLSIELKTGRKLLIGTRRPDELSLALKLYITPKV